MNTTELIHPDFKLAAKLSTSSVGTVFRYMTVKAMLQKAFKRVLAITDQSVVREAVSAYFNNRIGKERVHFSENDNVQAVYAWLECLRYLARMGTMQTSDGFLPSMYYCIPHPRFKGTYAISRTTETLSSVRELVSTLSHIAGTTQLKTFMSDKDYRPTLHVMQDCGDRVIDVVGGLVYEKVKGKPKNKTLPF